VSERGRVVKAGSKVRLALASDEWLVACVRRGDTAAFEALYDRHVRELLAFCMYMLGSRQDAEDAVQATFASAYRALRADTRPVTLRPWLFTIARNDCLTILRKRRPLVELNGEIDPGLDPVAEIEVKDEVRKVFDGLRELPENQRAALVMAEVHGLSQQEIGGVLGVRTDQVKAYVYQARSKLISDRRARDADCHEIREELASARGAALLRGRLRRHVRSCPECRRFADGMARQRRQLGALLPIAPSLALKYRAVEEAMSAGASEPATVASGAAVGASVAGTAADIAGGGMKLLACKVAAGVVCLGAGAGVGVSALEGAGSSATQGATTAAVIGAGALASAQEPGGANGWSATLPGFDGGAGGSARSDAASGRGLMTDSGQPVTENPGAGRLGKASTPPGGAGDGASRSDGSGRSGQGSQQAGRQIREKGDQAADREMRATNTRERTRLRREGSEREAEERQLAKEAPTPPRTGPRTPRSEQELAERHEHRQRLHEERKPEGHSRFPESEEERAEKRERRKRKVEERRKRKLEEEEQRAAEAEAPTG
jgi:RNA polymerase sigma factor (sigma-70 family)